MNVRYRSAVAVASPQLWHFSPAALFSPEAEDQVPPLLSDNIFHPPVVS
jgi:hypothetical protein